MPGGGELHPFPEFFLSYAHANQTHPGEKVDADHWVRRFHGDLCAEIGTLIDVPPGREPGFIDRHLRIGEHWPERLADRLARCSVFVPLYTPRYFRRPDCGREWSVIRQRQDMHVAACGECPEIVIPVLWEPVTLDQIPVWARSIQHVDDSMSPRYRELGLEMLLRLRDLRPHYTQAVRLIAERIVGAAQREDQLYQLSPAPRFQSLPDAFGVEENPVDGQPSVRITVAALDKHAELPAGRSKAWYGENADDWCPYREDARADGWHTPVAWRAADVARRREIESQVTVLSEESEEIGRGRPSAPTVLLVDAWATLDPKWRALLERLDAAIRDKPWIRVILPWNNRDEETAANGPVLRDAVRSALKRSFASGRVPLRRGELGPGSSSAFGPEVSEAIRTTLVAFMRDTEKYPPPGPSRGKPRLRGPGAAGHRRAVEDEDGE